MPRGDKSSYTDKQKRQAAHILAGEKEQGRSEDAAERIAWATVNKQDGGGKKRAPAKKAATGSTVKKATRTATARRTTARTPASKTTG